jgi:hypothetical protein
MAEVDDDDEEVEDDDDDDDLFMIRVSTYLGLCAIPRRLADYRQAASLNLASALW